MALSRDILWAADVPVCPVVTVIASPAGWHALGVARRREHVKANKNKAASSFLEGSMLTTGMGGKHATPRAWRAHRTEPAPEIFSEIAAALSRIDLGPRNDWKAEGTGHTGLRTCRASTAGTSSRVPTSYVGTWRSHRIKPALVECREIATSAQIGLLAIKHGRQTPSSAPWNTMIACQLSVYRIIFACCLILPKNIIY